MGFGVYGLVWNLGFRVWSYVFNWKNKSCLQYILILHFCLNTTPVGASSVQSGPVLGAWVLSFAKISNIYKNKFSELGLPGVQIVSEPCGSLLPTIRASQHPYNEKSEKYENLLC